MSVHSATKPWWQQATALVTVSTGGMVTGLTFAPGAAATMTSPTGPPVHLMALERAATSVHSSDTALSSDAALRSAIVNVAKYYLQLAKTRAPAQMEAMIWGKDSLDGTDHGQSCAAFASLTLELGAQAVGQRSWVSGGSSYPWPVHEWADPRVDPSPDSPSVTSMLADAQARGRWHAAGDGYQPQPGDWVLFHQHAEVVTGYSSGVLDTIGADSLPGYTVNAHTFGGSLAEHGIAGFVDNGHLAADGTSQSTSSGTGSQNTGGPGAGSQSTGSQSTGSQSTGSQSTGSQSTSGPGTGSPSTGVQRDSDSAPGAQRSAAPAGDALLPGLQAPPVQESPSQDPSAREPAAQGHTAPGHSAQAKTVQAVPAAAIPGLVDAVTGGSGSAVIPGLTPAGGGPAGGHYTRHSPPASASAPASTPGTKGQRAFISAVAPGAIAAQQRYGVPASVTIAQAIEESEWGTSTLAASDHNLFGIKGAGPAGVAEYPTQEFISGVWETITAGFRAYHNMAESISDHAELLATSGHYTRAMADRAVPDAFANDLTGVYATDPEYGSNLIATMKLYNLYRYDTAGPSVIQQSAPAAQAAAPHPAAPGVAAPSSPPPPTAPLHTAPLHTAPLHTAPAPAAPSRAASQPPSVAPPAPARTAPQPPPAAPTAPVPPVAPMPDPLAAPTAPAPGYQSAPSRAGGAVRGAANIPGLVTSMIPAKTSARYTSTLPAAVTTAYFTTAKTPLTRGELLYRDVASHAGISWKLLAACDWMQCQAHPRYSPVHGEKLGSVNRDGSVYATKSEALAQCAADMVALARAVYGIDLTVPRPMSVRALAEVFAAFRWGGLLRKHGVSAMEFPYAVAGLTENHAKMHWPAIGEPNAPDKPGGKFRQPFGAVPVVLSLNYPATI